MYELYFYLNFCDFIKILAHFSKYSIKNVGSFWLELNFLWLVLARAKYFCKPTLARLEPEFLTKGTGSARAGIILARSTPNPHLAFHRDFSWNLTLLKGNFSGFGNPVNWKLEQFQIGF